MGDEKAKQHPLPTPATLSMVKRAASEGRRVIAGTVDALKYDRRWFIGPLRSSVTHAGIAEVKVL